MRRQITLGKPIPMGDILRLIATVGGRIAITRHAAGMSQWELASKVHRSQSLISLWERGHVPPDAEDIKHLAKALRCTQSYLLTDPAIVGAAQAGDEAA